VLCLRYIALDGLHIHDSVKQVVATALRAGDPSKYRDFRGRVVAVTHGTGYRGGRRTCAVHCGHALPAGESGVREAFFPAVRKFMASSGAASMFRIRAICERMKARRPLSA